MTIVSEQYAGNLEPGDERSSGLVPDTMLGGLVVAQEVAPQLFEEGGFQHSPYGYRDAVSQARDCEALRWSVLDSSLRAYERSFEGVLGKHGGRIANLLPEAPGRPVVAVDLMATPAALADLRREYLGRPQNAGTPFRGFAVGLSDSRTAYGHHSDLQFVKGNLRYAATMRTLAGQMGGEQADLIMERAVGGFSGVPQHRKFFQAAFARLWDVLRPGGVMLLQTHSRGIMASAGVNMPEVVARLGSQGVSAQTNDNPYLLSDAILIRKPALPAN